jgi:hypothetical protein
MSSPRLASLALACLAVNACQGGGNPPASSGDAGASPVAPPPSSGAPPTAADPGATGGPAAGAPAAGGGWVTASLEDFEHLDPGSPAWQADPVPDDGPFADAGLYFTQRGITPPAAFRISQALGSDGWLTAEAYTRSASTPFSRLVSVVPDPANAANHVLRIASPAHTDAAIIRSSAPLPQRYRISLRVGFPSFGDGKPGLNGYATGAETAEPWWPDSAVEQNGFYWLAILDAQPRPHNNTWIHHHRKLVFDSDNHRDPWMDIFDGDGFVTSGEHPLMMFALDGRGPVSSRTGKSFLSYAGGAWRRDLPPANVRAVDAYVPGTWYRVSIERFDTLATMEVSGRFRYGGETTYRATLDLEEACVWHFNRTAQEDASACVDEGSYPDLGGAQVPLWPAGATWPDYFMFGDPHVNYYTGEVFYDDVKLEVWQP